MTTDQNRVTIIDPDALVILTPGVALAGVRHDLIDGHNTVALVDLARHVLAMHDLRESDAGTLDQLAAIAEHPAHAYVDSTTAPLPGRVDYGQNPTTELLARVSEWEQRGGDAPCASGLLRDAVQVVRTVAVDVLRVAAADVFDTGMPAYVARWLEGRALVLERGQDVHDADVLDAAISEVTAAAAAYARAELHP